MDNISKRFGGVQALKDVSVDVFPGDVLGIIGPNGSGKTTIAQLLLHMFEPNSGEIVVDEVSLNNYDLQSLRSIPCDYWWYRARRPRVLFLGR